MDERKKGRSRGCFGFLKKVSAYWLACKRKFCQLFTIETINVLVSIVISVSIEFFRQILMVSSKVGQDDQKLTGKQIIDILFSSNVANICLITILIWCITGCIRLISEKKERGRPLWLTIFVFVGLILSIGWYIVETVFSDNSVIVTLIGCGLLFLLLLIYFSEPNVACVEDTDYCVAPQPSN